MDDDVDTLERPAAHLGVAAIPHDQVDARIAERIAERLAQHLPAARGQVVEYHHPVDPLLGQQPAHEGGADESGTADHAPRPTGAHVIDPRSDSHLVGWV